MEENTTEVVEKTNNNDKNTSKTNLNISNSSDKSIPEVSLNDFSKFRNYESDIIGKYMTEKLITLAYYKSMRNKLDSKIALNCFEFTKKLNSKMIEEENVFCDHEKISYDLLNIINFEPSNDCNDNKYKDKENHFNISSYNKTSNNNTLQNCLKTKIDINNEKYNDLEPTVKSYQKQIEFEFSIKGKNVWNKWFMPKAPKLDYYTNTAVKVVKEHKLLTHPHISSISAITNNDDANSSHNNTNFGSLNQSKMQKNIKKLTKIKESNQQESKLSSRSNVKVDFKESRLRSNTEITTSKDLHRKSLTADKISNKQVTNNLKSLVIKIEGDKNVGNNSILNTNESILDDKYKNTITSANKTIEKENNTEDIDDGLIYENDPEYQEEPESEFLKKLRNLKAKEIRIKEEEEKRRQLIQERLRKQAELENQVRSKEFDDKVAVNYLGEVISVKRPVMTDFNDYKSPGILVRDPIQKIMITEIKPNNNTNKKLGFNKKISSKRKNPSMASSKINFNKEGKDVEKSVLNSVNTKQANKKTSSKQTTNKELDKVLNKDINFKRSDKKGKEEAKENKDRKEGRKEKEVKIKESNITKDKDKERSNDKDKEETNILGGNNFDFIQPEVGVKIVDGNKAKDGGSNYKIKYGHISSYDYRVLINENILQSVNKIPTYEEINKSHIEDHFIQSRSNSKNKKKSKPFSLPLLSKSINDNVRMKKSIDKETGREYTNVVSQIEKLDINNRGLKGNNNTEVSVNYFKTNLPNKLDLSNINKFNQNLLSNKYWGNDKKAVDLLMGDRMELRKPKVFNNINLSNTNKSAIVNNTTMNNYSSLIKPSFKDIIINKLKNSTNVNIGTLENMNNNLNDSRLGSDNKIINKRLNNEINTGKYVKVEGVYLDTEISKHTRLKHKLLPASDDKDDFRIN